jgi:hypothetical protein
MRRAFNLSEVDREFLDSRGKSWETLVEGPSRWVIVGGLEVPQGYNHSTVAVASLLDASYPDVQIDMAYFFPALARADGKSIGALSSQQLDGKFWQRWSRHRVGADAWRPGIDNIETHLLFVTAFLDQELRKHR